MAPQDKRAELAAMAEAGMSGLAAYRRGEEVVKSDQMAAIDAALDGARSRGAGSDALSALDGIVRPVGDAAQGRLQFAGGRHADSMSEQGSAIDRFTSRAGELESSAYDLARADAERRVSSAGGGGGGGGGLSDTEMKLRAWGLGSAAAQEDGAAAWAQAEQDRETARIGILAEVSDGALNSDDARVWLDEKKAEHGAGFEEWFDSFVEREANKTGQQRAYVQYLADRKRDEKAMRNALEAAGVEDPGSVPAFVDVPMLGGRTFRAQIGGQNPEPDRVSMADGVIAPVMGDEYTSLADSLYQEMLTEAASRSLAAEDSFVEDRRAAANLLDGLLNNQYAADAYAALGYGDPYVAQALFDPYRTSDPANRVAATREAADLERYGMPFEEYQALMDQSGFGETVEFGFAPTVVEEWAETSGMDTPDAVAVATDPELGAIVLDAVAAARLLAETGASMSDVRVNAAQILREELVKAGMDPEGQRDEMNALVDLLGVQLDVALGAYSGS